MCTAQAGGLADVWAANRQRLEAVDVITEMAAFGDPQAT